MHSVSTLVLVVIYLFVSSTGRPAFAEELGEVSPQEYPEISQRRHDGFEAARKEGARQDDKPLEHQEHQVGVSTSTSTGAEDNTCSATDGSSCTASTNAAADSAVATAPAAAPAAAAAAVPPVDSTANTAGSSACPEADGPSCTRNTAETEQAAAAAAKAAAAAAKAAAAAAKKEEEHAAQLREERAVRVETGERDGIRVEFAGRTEGTIPEPSHGSSSATSREAAAAASTAATAATGIRFQLLRCDGDSHLDSIDGGLTVKGIWSHLRNKLEKSWEDNAQLIAPKPDGTPPNPEADGGVARTAGAQSGSAGFGQALVMATAPMYHLFGLLGGIPGWFSDVVFEVSVKEGSVGKDLPQRLVLVQNRSRFTTLACSLVGPPSPLAGGETDDDASSSSLPWPPVSEALSTATALAPRLARKFCSMDSPFPGKVVSRPCRGGSSTAAAAAAAAAATTATTTPASDAQPKGGWVQTIVQASLSAVGFGSSSGGGGGAGSNGGGGRGGSAGGGGGRGDGVCVCPGGAGEGGSCTIRASPGRDPCLYLEVDEVPKSRRAGRESSSYSADGVSASSAVELRTYNLEATSATTAAVSEGKRRTGMKAAPRAGEGAAERAAEAAGGMENVTTAMVNALGALQAAAVERGLPSSFTVPVYAAMLVAGVTFLLVARSVSESRVFHFLLSFLLGAAVAAAAIILRALKNPRCTLLRLVFFGGFAMWLVVAAGGGLVPSPADLLSNVPAAALALWTDGLVGWPLAGKAFFAISGLVGVIITRWQGLFLEEDDGPRGSWFNGQACIRRVLTALGMFLVYHGVSDADVGLALVMLALASPTLAHYGRRYGMWSNSSKWYRAGKRLSQAEYDAQGAEYTEQAIAALRESTRDDWDIMKKLKDSTSRKRMTNFGRTGNHYVPPAEEQDAGRGSCSVQ